MPKWNNFNYIFEAVKNNGRTLKYTSKELQNNYDIVLEAVKNNGMSLEYASNELQNNYNIVFEAVKKNSFSLQYASNELKNNYDIVFEAVKKNYNVLKFASNNINYTKIKKLIYYINNKRSKKNLIFIINNLKYLIKYEHIQTYLIKNKNKIINNWSQPFIYRHGHKGSKLCNNKHIINNIDILEEILNIKFIDITLF